MSGARRAILLRTWGRDTGPASVTGLRGLSPSTYFVVHVGGSQVVCSFRMNDPDGEASPKSVGGRHPSRMRKRTSNSEGGMLLKKSAGLEVPTADGGCKLFAMGVFLSAALHGAALGHAAKRLHQWRVFRRAPAVGISKPPSGSSFQQRRWLLDHLSSTQDSDACQLARPFILSRTLFDGPALSQRVGTLALQWVAFCAQSWADLCYSTTSGFKLVAALDIPAGVCIAMWRGPCRAMLVPVFLWYRAVPKTRTVLCCSGRRQRREMPAACRDDAGVSARGACAACRQRSSRKSSSEERAWCRHAARARRVRGVSPAELSEEQLGRASIPGACAAMPLARTEREDGARPRRTEREDRARRFKRHRARRFKRHGTFLKVPYIRHL